MQKIDIGFNISASCLDTFEQCHYKWSHKYVKKTPIVEPRKSWLVIGNAFHSLMENFYKRGAEIDEWDYKWLLSNWEKYLKDEAKAKVNEKSFIAIKGANSEDIFNELKESNFIKNGKADSKKTLKLSKDFKQYEKQIIDIIEDGEYNFSEFDKIQGYSLIKKIYPMLVERDWLVPPKVFDGKVGAEIWFSFKFEAHPIYEPNIVGKIDLIIEKEGVNVIDWKTGKNQVEKIEDSIQLILYSAALLKVFNIDEESLYLVYPNSGDCLKFTVKNNHYEILKKKIMTMLDVLHSKIFKKMENQYCKYCEYQEICEGRE